MELFSKETINTKRKEQTRELVIKNDRLVKSLKKVLSLQNDIEFDADKAKKVQDYQVWCEDMQTKMSTELKTLKAYEKLTEEKKEEYYNLVTRIDALEDRIITLQEESGRLELQVNFKKELLKQHG